LETVEKDEIKPDPSKAHTAMLPPIDNSNNKSAKGLNSGEATAQGINLFSEIKCNNLHQILFWTTGLHSIMK
jgi:hypothetical protein